MSEEDSEDKSIRVPAFNGEDEQCQKCWTRFKAHSKLAGFNKTLKDAPEEHLPNGKDEEDALTDTEEDTQKKK